MREHLDDLRAFHHFFNISVFLPQLPLLRAEVTTRLAHDLLQRKLHDHNHHQRDQRQRHAHNDH